MGLRGSDAVRDAVDSHTQTGPTPWTATPWPRKDRVPLDAIDARRNAPFGGSVMDEEQSR